VFPLLLLIVTRFSRQRKWLAPFALGALFALSLAAQMRFAVTDPNHAYYGTDTRAYQLLAGRTRLWRASPPRGPAC